MRRTLFLFTLASALVLPLGGTGLLAADQATTTNSTEHTGRHHEALVRIRKALAKLDLTADQKTKIETIITDTKTKLQNLRSTATNTTDKSTLREEAKTIVKKALEDIRNVLTPEQRDQLREMRETKGAAKKN